MTNESKQPALIAYAVRENGEKSFFTRIGAAWPNAKGGYGIELEAVPVNGKIVLFPPKEGESE
ncbi:MAG: hypothetical protein GWQ08_20180 [Verrucomicrobiaceae bacterium]|nr:hypothetical protein [Verrucomicrobiaceae bacterium]